MKGPERRFYGRRASSLDLPGLVDHQLESFDWLVSSGLSEAMAEVQFEDGGERLEIGLHSPVLGEPAMEVAQCMDLRFSHEARLSCSMRIRNVRTGEITEREDVKVCMMPVMTPDGGFVVSGSRRAVVSQFVRAPGVYFSVHYDSKTGDNLATARFLPRRGTRLTFEMSSKRVLMGRMDSGRRFNSMVFLRALGFSRSEVEAMVADADPVGEWMGPTFEAAGAMFDSEEECLVHLLSVMDPSAPSSVERAREHLTAMLMSSDRISLGRLGRDRLNASVGIESDSDVLGFSDVFEIVRCLLMIQVDRREPDDVDHLGNRRVRRAGELIAESFRQGLLAARRATVERLLGMDDDDLWNLGPSRLISFEHVERAVRRFFSASPLCQFLDNTNLLSEITHKRRITALGPGGIDRRRAGTDVRDVHQSYYGRICPIESPEGQNIGLVNALAAGARFDVDGFILAPYLKVRDAACSSDAAALAGRQVRESVVSDDGEILLREGLRASAPLAEEISRRCPGRELAVAPYVSGEVHWLGAYEEEGYRIGQASVGDNPLREIERGDMEARHGGAVIVCDGAELDFVNLSVRQMFSASTLMIPFLNHNDANRALMGANMQRQALPLERPEGSLVSTGMDRHISKSPEHSVWAVEDGTVLEATSSLVTVWPLSGDDKRERLYPVRPRARSNQNTYISQRTRVRVGEVVRAGDCLADGYGSDDGRLALGQNVLVAFMSWEGFNYEDSIVISEKVRADGRFRSTHIKDHHVMIASDSPEQVTRSVPGISRADAARLDEDGLIRVGVRVHPGDVLVGKRTPRGESEMDEELLMLRLAADPLLGKWRNTSLVAGRSDYGVVVESRMVAGTPEDPLPTGVGAMARVGIVRTRPLEVGDKMSGRHGNKGLVSVILPVEDMPVLPDGRTADVVLNPLGVPSRMNLGQLMEVHMGMAASELGFYAETPAFDGATWTQIQDALAEAHVEGRFDDPKDAETPERWIGRHGSPPSEMLAVEGALARVVLGDWLFGEDFKLPEDVELSDLVWMARVLEIEDGLPSPVTGKLKLRDGRSGEYLPGCQTVGVKHMLKLSHLAGDKMHARSVGTYQEVTQQPFAGKSQGGGQRLGEMEVWALESYGAAHNLLEMMTVKSDDVEGRARTYAGIIGGSGYLQASRPESFRVLASELAAVGISLEALQKTDFGAEQWFRVVGT